MAAVIRNTIVLGSAAGYGILAGSSPNISIQYCDVYDNLPANFTGFPANLGLMTGININGDSCDVYHNINGYPEFVNPNYGDFHLQANSPCIDAGDPTSPLDPDNTIADIGAFYFFQAPPQLDVTLTPISPPITIPAIGGSFSFNVTLTRIIGPMAPYVVWTRIKNPDGTYTGNMLGPVTVNTPVGVTVTRTRIQNVPGMWSSGEYTYLGYVNTSFAYPAVDSSSFTFTKLADGPSGPFVWDASCTGETFPYAVTTASAPTAYALIGANPNPFNLTTDISYQLSANSHVCLKVYEVSGKLVKTLVDGWRDAGLHEVTFDGSELPSGLYLYHLEAVNQSTTGRMVLLK